MRSPLPPGDATLHFIRLLVADPWGRLLVCYPSQLVSALWHKIPPTIQTALERVREKRDAKSKQQCAAGPNPAAATTPTAVLGPAGSSSSCTVPSVPASGTKPKRSLLLKRQQEQQAQQLLEQGQQIAQLTQSVQMLTSTLQSGGQVGVKRKVLPQPVQRQSVDCDEDDIDDSFFCSGQGEQFDPEEEEGYEDEYGEEEDMAYDDQEGYEEDDEIVIKPPAKKKRGFVLKEEKASTLISDPSDELVGLSLPASTSASAAPKARLAEFWQQSLMIQPQSQLYREDWTSAFTPQVAKKWLAPPFFAAQKRLPAIPNASKYFDQEKAAIRAQQTAAAHGHILLTARVQAAEVCDDLVTMLQKEDMGFGECLFQVLDFWSIVIACEERCVIA
jgi:hypothetical protein